MRISETLSNRESIDIQRVYRNPHKQLHHSITLKNSLELPYYITIDSRKKFRMYPDHYRDLERAS